MSGCHDGIKAGCHEHDALKNAPILLKLCKASHANTSLSRLLVFSLGSFLLYLLQVGRERRGKSVHFLQVGRSLAREQQQEPGTLAATISLLCLFFSSLIPEPNTAE